MDIELGVQTAREVGHTIGQIPIVGYILFGKDKSLVVGVKITGTLEKPKVHTNPVGDALLYPLKLIGRTLTAPAHLIAPSSPSKREKTSISLPAKAKESSESNVSGGGMF